MSAALKGAPNSRPRRMRTRNAHGRDRRGDAHRPQANRRRRGKHEPAGGEIAIEPELDRQRPQRAVEFALKRVRLEHAGQRIADAADQRRAFDEIVVGLGRGEIIGERQRGQRRGENEDGEDQHHPDRWIDPKRPRPQESDDISPVDEAAGDQKAAGDEEHVNRHFGQRQAEMVEEEFPRRRQSERRDAVAEQDRERRHEADEVEVVVPADGVFGESRRRP